MSFAASSKPFSIMRMKSAWPKSSSCENGVSPASRMMSAISSAAALSAPVREMKKSGCAAAPLTRLSATASGKCCNQFVEKSASYASSPGAPVVRRKS